MRVYNRDTNEAIGWKQVGGDIDGEAANDQSGHSVAMSSDGTRIAIGAPYNDVYSGHVRVYEYDATKTTAVTDQTSSTFGPIGWNRVGGDIDGEDTDDFSGYSVAMNSSGTRIAIGAPYNDGVNGTRSGHVRVYDYKIPTTDEWTNGNVIKEGDTDQESGKSYFTQVGGDIDGEDIYNGYLGLSVALSLSLIHI